MFDGLYFPGLQPEREWAVALLSLVERLVVYGVVEEEVAPGQDVAPFETRLVAPLGDDAPRFRALLREMTGREAAVIRGQLLAQAPQVGRDRDEAHGWSLSRALHRMDGGDEDLARARAERVWQARLFLKLAETVSAAEAEISRGLAQMAARQAAMLKALQGDDEEGCAVAPPPLRPRPDRIFRLRDQLAAWAVFYWLDPAPEPLLLTDDPEAAALLVDEVEKLAPGKVVPLPDLGLSKEGLEKLVKALQDISAGGLEAGQAAIKSLAGASGGGSHGILRLQLLPGREFRLVMARLSGLPGEDGANALPSPYVLVGAFAPGEVICKD